PQKLINIVVKS
ncbi:MAG: hypothetical protein COY19_03340, partial [Candidatus Marinimicrobia bacterium CG_4_10_14_0_2_um_filter_48_9]